MKSIIYIKEQKQKLRDLYDAVTIPIISFCISVRLWLKKKFNKKLNIVFVCHRPKIWPALKTIYDACMEDPHFKVSIVAVPNKKQLPIKGLNHDIYETEGAEEFFRSFPCEVIKGYDYETSKWFQLKHLKPDYIFFQTPYNICRPYEYYARKIACYARICYISYMMPFVGGKECTDFLPQSFAKYIWFAFAETSEVENFYKNYLDKVSIYRNYEVYLSGSTKFDELHLYRGKEWHGWLYKREDRRFRMIWTPRWSTREDNCHFFDYKDKLLKFVWECDDYELLFRPHPQMELELIANGDILKSVWDEYIESYKECNNAMVDKEISYLPQFYSCDVLITDESSIIIHFFLTGKPIIFCKGLTHFNELVTNISKGFYWVSGWDELKDTLEMLRGGEDPLQDIRKKLIEENYYINPYGAGRSIKEFIMKRSFYET